MAAHCTSLLLLLFFQSSSKKSSRQYAAASRMGTYALVLTTITLVFSILSWLLYIALIVAIAGEETKSSCGQLIYDADLGFSKLER